MKQLVLIICATAAISLPIRASASEPRGSMLELHSCELYAGGCIVSSQATLEGRYLLRAWNFAEGAFQGTSLAGLSVAVLESASENLSPRNTQPEQAVIYLPTSASPEARQALLSWVRNTLPDLNSAVVHTRTVPISFGRDGSAGSFTAGDFISVKTGSIEECNTGSCGEALWYTPKAETSVFTVALNRASAVNEPLLSLKWQDGGKRSVFLGRFGLERLNQEFVSLTDLCGPGGLLF